MGFLPGPLDDYKGEQVLYATGYRISNKLIKLHLFLGLLCSITIIGMALGIPIILRGYYLSQNIQKAIIITKEHLYEILNGKQIFSVAIDDIENIMWRPTRMGFLELKIEIRGKFLDHIIKGNFYENEFHIIMDTLASRAFID